jgi:hypothetical protein
MHLHTFEDLLLAAALQQQPQRLLLTFARAEVDPESGGRRTLVPAMCVDKQVGDLDTFANLAQEAATTGLDWDVVLVTTLSGSTGQLPDARRTDDALNAMVAAVRAGNLQRFVGFDRDGGVLQFH